MPPRSACPEEHAIGIGLGPPIEDRTAGRQIHGVGVNGGCLAPGAPAGFPSLLRLPVGSAGSGEPKVAWQALMASFTLATEISSVGMQRLHHLRDLQSLAAATHLRRAPTRR